MPRRQIQRAPAIDGMSIFNLMAGNPDLQADPSFIPATDAELSQLPYDLAIQNTTPYKPFTGMKAARYGDRGTNANIEYGIEDLKMRKALENQLAIEESARKYNAPNLELWQQQQQEALRKAQEENAALKTNIQIWQNEQALKQQGQNIANKVAQDTAPTYTGLKQAELNKANFENEGAKKNRKLWRQQQKAGTNQTIAATDKTLQDIDRTDKTPIHVNDGFNINPVTGQPFSILSEQKATEGTFDPDIGKMIPGTPATPASMVAARTILPDGTVVRHTPPPGDARGSSDIFTGPVAETPHPFLSKTTNEQPVPSPFTGVQAQGKPARMGFDEFFGIPKLNYGRSTNTVPTQPTPFTGVQQGQTTNGLSYLDRIKLDFPYLFPHTGPDEETVKRNRALTSTPFSR